MLFDPLLLLQLDTNFTLNQCRPPQKPASLSSPAPPPALPPFEPLTPAVPTTACVVLFFFSHAPPARLDIENSGQTGPAGAGGEAVGVDLARDEGGSTECANRNSARGGKEACVSET